MHRGHTVDQPPQWLRRVRHDVAAGQDQTVNRRVEFGLGELVGNVAQQPAAPANLFDKLWHTRVLIDEPAEVPTVERVPVVVGRTLTGGHGKGDCRDAGVGGHDVREQLRSRPFTDRRLRETTRFGHREKLAVSHCPFRPAGYTRGTFEVGNWPVETI